MFYNYLYSSIACTDAAAMYVGHPAKYRQQSLDVNFPRNQLWTMQWLFLDQTNIKAICQTNTPGSVVLLAGFLQQRQIYWIPLV